AMSVPPRADHGRPTANPFSLSFARPGRPATVFTAGAAVGATQKIAPSVGFELSLTGVSSTPFTATTSPTIPLVKRHSRRWGTQVPVSGQSAIWVAIVQLRCCSGAAQLLSVGPSIHSPSLSPIGSVSTQPEPRQAFGAVACPALPQVVPPG